MGGLAYHAAKDVVFIADASNHMIRALEKGDIKSVVGVDVPPAGHEGGFEDGDGDTARFDNPQVRVGTCAPRPPPPHPPCGN